MFGIATIQETYGFYRRGLPLSGLPIPFSTRQWEYPWCYLRLLDAGLRPGARILDVGCAKNQFMIDLSQKGFLVKGLDLYSVDDPRNPNPGFGGFDRSLESETLSFCKGNMANIPAMNDEFDAVYCLSVLEHADESTRLAGLTEMLRVLKPDHPLIITEDYIPEPIPAVKGVLKPCSRQMNYDFREHIKATGRPLADPTTVIPTDQEITEMRDKGKLLLNASVAVEDFYHFTAVGWVVNK
jgi:SAM-dependent methyltransferase